MSKQHVTRRESEGQDHLPPHSDEIERAALGCVVYQAMDHRTEAVAMLGQLRQSDFYGLRHQEIFGAMRCLWLEGKPLDTITVRQWLVDKDRLEAAGGVAYLFNLSDDVIPASFDGYVNTLRDKAARREIIQIAGKAENLARDESQDPAALAVQFAELAGTVSGNGSGLGGRLSVRSPDEILRMTFDNADCIWGDRLLATGQSLAIVGPGGIGKSRLILQGAVAQITGRPFLGFESPRPARRWLILQGENSNRRLYDDFEHLARWVGPSDWKKVNEYLFIHTLENDLDALLTLNAPYVADRMEEAVQGFKADAVVCDSLYNFGIGDLNTDADMFATLTTLARIVRKGNPHRMIVPLHHALTGKSGAARALGYDRASYGRNSKVLHSWTRAQINIAPGGPDENPPLVLTCGKNNNGKEFPPFAVRLNPETMIYEIDRVFDLEGWASEMTSNKPVVGPLMTPDRVCELCKGPMTKADLARAIEAASGCVRSSAYRYIDQAEEKKKIKFNPAHETYLPR